MWEKLKKRFWQWRGVLIAAPSVAAAVLLLRWVGVLQPIELFVLDKLFLLRPPEPTDPRIVIVTIDEPDVQNVVQWPMADNILAKLLDNIRQQKPRAIGLDLYRDLPHDPGHAELEQLFRTTPNLIGVQKVSRSRESSPVNPPPLLKAQDQVGSNDLPLDSGGTIRRGILYLTTEEGDSLYSFSLRLANLYLEARGVEINDQDPNQVKVGSRGLPIFTSNTGGYQGADAKGYQILLNYRGPIQKFTTVSMTQVMNGNIPPHLFSEKVVLIGSTAESLKDIFYTPYQRMAGVVIHANLVSQIISTGLEQRPAIQTWPKAVENLWVFSFAVAGALLSWCFRYREDGSKGSQNRLAQLPWGTLSVILVAGCLPGAGYLSFLIGWWIPIVPALLSLVGSALAITGYIASSAAEMRKTFGRYLTTEVVASLLESPTGLKLGGESRKVTILMSDLRGFSAMSGQLPPETVVKILNYYLEAMTDTITQYKGTINEIMGDGIFVMFGAPTNREDDSRRAIACALAMELAMDRVNQYNLTMGYPKLDMGIGINTGEVVAGNIGSQKRAKYTVVGNAVNLASRVESYTVGGQILVSEVTYGDALGQQPDLLQVRGQLKVAAKGIKEPITLYDISGIGGKYNLQLPIVEEIFIPLQPEQSLKYVALEGKHMAGTVFQGSFVKLSDQGAVMRLDHALDSLTNLKINLLTASEEVVGDLYAKVIRNAPEGELYFYVRFTAVPTTVAQVLDQYRNASPSGTA